MTNNELYEDLRQQQRSLQTRVKSIRTWYSELSMKEVEEDDFESELEFNDFNGRRTELVIDMGTWMNGCGQMMLSHVDEKTERRAEEVGKTIKILKRAMRKTKALGDADEEEEERKEEEKWLRECHNSLGCGEGKKVREKE